MENITINFGGFYNSLYDMSIDDIVEREIDYHSEENNFWNEKDCETFRDSINYKQIHINIAKKIVDLVNNKLNLKLEFDSVWSPKEYNFDTDKIVCKEMDSLQILEIWNILYKLFKDEDLLDDYNDQLKYVTTSRSGYHAFYEMHELTITHKVEIMLEMLFNDDDFRMDIFYDIDGNHCEWFDAEYPDYDECNA